MVDILPVALANIRAFPEKATPEQFKQFEQWAKTALEQTNDQERLKMLLAELYDLEGRYDEVTKIYRELLANEKTSRVIRAYAQNNLAFILAAVNPSPERGAEAEKLIEQAIAIMGPTSDLLDTRALTYLAQGKVDQAAADLKAAVGDQPTTSKYYHLAQVEKKMGNVDGAKAAIAKAVELHGDRNQFTPVERRGYEQLKSELN
jgi:tetratricopeptide (TPR) repeat protein